MLHHKKLVKEVMAHLKINQSQLAESINNLRKDGRQISQSTVWKWLNKDYIISVEDCVRMDQLTNGKVSVFRFYPSLKCVNTAKAKRTKQAA